MTGRTSGFLNIRDGDRKASFWGCECGHVTHGTQSGNKVVCCSAFCPVAGRAEGGYFVRTVSL